jgi:hypothetical protein
MTIPDRPDPWQKLIHLSGQICANCGHPHIAHWHNPGCRQCGCVRDPLCRVCGQLTSKHDDGAPDANV